MSAPDIFALRSEFPMLEQKIHGKRLVYLDSAATAMKPKAVIDAMSHFYLHEYATAYRSIYDLSAAVTAKIAHVRVQIASWIGAKSPSEIVFTQGTTHSLNLVTRTFADEILTEGDEVVISIAEHHANFIPWQMLCKRKKATLRIIPLQEDGRIDLEYFYSILSAKTKIVAIHHISNVTGIEAPIKEMAKAIHDRGGYIVVDGAQGIVNSSVNVHDLDVDFYAFSMHKLYGPTGIGILYGKQALLSQMPPLFYGGDMIEEVRVEETTFQSPPLRFEAGTPPLAEIIGTGAAFSFLESIDYAGYISYKKHLTDSFQQALIRVRDLNILYPETPKHGCISFTCKNAHPYDVATMMGVKGVALRSGHMCAQPLLTFLQVPSLLRISLGIYTLPDEIEYAIFALKEAQALLSEGSNG